MKRRCLRLLLLVSGILACLSSAREAAAQNVFYRGDCNASGEPGGMAVDLADATALVSHLFAPAESRFQPRCRDACDANDDGLVDFADMVTVLQYSFQHGRFPPVPGPGIVPGGASTSPGPDPTADRLDCAAAAQAPALENCNNGTDDDGDGHADAGDPDCQILFACGRGGIDDADLNSTYPPWRLQPGPVRGAPGGQVVVDFFIRHPDGVPSGTAQFAYLQGFSMALAFDCQALSAMPYFDISYTALEGIIGGKAILGLLPEFVSLDVDNDRDDGDGCEAIIGVLLDVLPPYFTPDLQHNAEFIEIIEMLPPEVRELYVVAERVETPPSDEFQSVGRMWFDVKEGVTCGQCYRIDFADGVDGRGGVPGRNLVIGSNSSRAPQLMGCEVCVEEPERFYRGDCNYSRQAGGAAVDLADAAAVLSHLFGRGTSRFEPPCLDACDANDDGAVNLSDAVDILDYLFSFDRLPPAPGPGRNPQGQTFPAGVDPTPDILDCAAGSACDALPPGGGGGPAMEICNNGIDDDGDLLVDRDDPDCRQVFAAGARALDPVTGGPAAAGGPPGSTVDVCFFIKNRDDEVPGPVQVDHLQGFTMALAFPCDLAAEEVLDVSGTILEAAGAEFVAVQADNDPADGDGCELIVGALLDLLPPFRGQTLPPAEEFEPIGCVPFRIRDDRGLCGQCLAIAFQDGVNGSGRVPVSNQFVGANRSWAPGVLNGEVCVGDLDTDGDGRLDTCLDGLGADRPFRRGDVDANGRLNLADALYLLDFLFLRGPPPSCRQGADLDRNGGIELTDGVYLLNHLFLGGPEPPDPHRSCGRDPGAGRPSCIAYRPCAAP